MLSKPQPDEIREAECSFNEVYETLTSCEKSNFHQIINFFKICLGLYLQFLPPFCKVLEI